MTYTNNKGIPLSLAVFLAHDDYDHINDPNVISVTTLLKPLKEIILSRRVLPTEAPEDISAFIKASLGSAVHQKIEQVWLDHYRESMTKLGWPENVINQIVMNPNPEDVGPDDLAIYFERRKAIEIEGFMVTGQCDLVMDGRLRDFKSTTTFHYIKDTNSKQHSWQGSMYRVIHSDIITEDTMMIDYIFFDWMQGKSYEKGYPPAQMMEKELPLFSVPETEVFMESKLEDIRNYMDADEQEIPECTDEELWRDAPTWKYYKNPENMKRSTKNFDNPQDANKRLMDDGNVGVVLEVPSKPVKCMYCSAAPVCQQAAGYVREGVITL